MANAIKLGKKTCNFYGGSGHWEKDCYHKKQGLPKGEAQSE